MKIINTYLVEYKNTLTFLYEVETTSPDPQKFFVKYTDHNKDGWIERTEEMQPEIALALITPPVDEPPVETVQSPAEEASASRPG